MQSAEYAWNGAVFGAGVRAGDFNLWPASAIHPYFQDGCAVDSAGGVYSNRTYDATETSLTAKIDYIWLCPGYSGSPPPPARQPHCDGTYSDHCYIFMNLTFA